MKKISLKSLLSALLLWCIAAIVYAQKQPNVQTESVRAPANVKVDGKTTEWKNQFQAYNHATEIYYTVANDDSKLYIVVQAPDRPVINKILRGGITFTVQRSGKKTDKDGISITYPLFDEKSTPRVPAIFGRTLGPGESVATPPGTYLRDNDSKDFKSDSMMMIYNKSLAYAKYIGVTGVNGLESQISVYNENGIIVAQLFDNKMCYTIEMAIDLKLLGLNANNATRFTYHINVNGLSPFVVADMQPLKARGDSSRTNPAAAASTDLWAEYTLAKK